MYSSLKIVTLVLISYNTTAITGSKGVGVQIERNRKTVRGFEERNILYPFQLCKKNSKLNPIESPWSSFTLLKFNIFPMLWTSFTGPYVMKHEKITGRWRFIYGIEMAEEYIPFLEISYVFSFLTPTPPLFAETCCVAVCVRNIG